MTEQEIYQYVDMTPYRGYEPVFRGTKILVTHIIDDFAKGMNFDEVLKEHPQLSTKHLQAAFVYCQIMIKENDLARKLLLYR